jgi:hypothetical protein
MQSTLKLSYSLTDKDQIKKTWAFAIDNRRFTAKRKQLADLRDCLITACSKEAKALGVRVGMRYGEAKALVPNIRIMVIGGGHA